ncbi:UDP-N-acetylmuramate--alanine ligase [hydrothermal vent metagenome]|uniref:UDP-N-acetylmuramate--L-alanine ligase n=1 Tax=hydrothermal vent metagenome TaxID=652676 RepID=A0A1W1D2I9_9ZZZZ
MKIHFIGIGGIGISGLAQYMHFQGHQVSGSDIATTPIIQKLRHFQMDITIPHNDTSIQNQDLIIHSAIIKQDNPEIIKAKEKNIPILSRKEALQQILQNKKVYSVAGAHGKSTTTAILAALMEGSAIIGAESKEFGSNIRYDEKSDVLLFEADESDESFIYSNPYCSIVINTEPEHMEYYNYDYERFFRAYEKFIMLAKKRVLNAEDPFLKKFVGKIDAQWLTPSKDITNITYLLQDDEPYTKFHLKNLGEFVVWGLGKHIALDASLAILASLDTLDIQTIKKKLLLFRGIKKRFDIVGSDAKCVLIDDYGHHPTEIKATLESVQVYKKLKKLHKVTAIWQPHKYSRTIDNLQEFVECFNGVDELIILPVWAAGETPQPIDFQNKFQKYNLTMAQDIKRDNLKINIIQNNTTIKTLDEGIIISFGAGDITYKIRGIDA